MVEDLSQAVLALQREQIGIKAQFKDPTAWN